MSKEHPSSNLQMIPIDKIEVLNPRDRNGRIFDDIVGNITGTPMAGKPACDKTPYGSYGSALIMVKNIQKFCGNSR